MHCHAARIGSRGIVVGVTLLLAAASCVNLHTVKEGGLYRAAQPDRQQLAHWIWRYRLQTVLTLRGGGSGNPNYDAVEGAAAAAGIDFVQVPLSASRFPPKDRLVQLAETLESARQPIFVHCMAGADRTGLASAVWVLQQTGDLEQARAQLSMRFGHLALRGTERLDQVLDLYEPWQAQMSFSQWARSVYQPPAGDELTGELLEQQRQLASASALTGR